MSDESIFTEVTPPVEPVVPPAAPVTPDIELPPEVSEYVGDGKKYKTLQDALKSIPHAQTHIQKLEQELESAKSEAARAKAMEELLEEIKKQGGNPTEPTTPQVATPVTPPVDIDKKVEEALARKEAARIAEANRLAVKAAFEQKYGSESEAYYIKLAEENGMPLATMNQLALTSPDAVLKLAGLKRNQNFVPKPTSSVNTAALQNNNNNTELSAKVPKGATTKDLTEAWKIAGQKVQQKFK